MSSEKDIRWINIQSSGDLFELSILDLKDYIRDRLYLSPPATSPALVFSQDEEPEDFVIYSFAGTNNPEVLKILHSAVALLISEEWKEAKTTHRISNGEYFSRLLYLIEYFRITQAQDEVYFFAANSEFLRDELGYYTKIVYEQILRALAVLQKGPPGYIELWVSILNSIEMYEFSTAAFTGLRFCSRKIALNYLPIYVRRIHENNKPIVGLSNSIIGLIDQYGENKLELAITEIVYRIASEKSRDVRLTVLEALNFIPIINQNHKNLLFPLLPWEDLSILFGKDELTSAEILKNIDVFNFARENFSNIIIELNNALNAQSKITVDIVNKIHTFLLLFNEIPEMKRSFTGSKFNSHKLLDKFSRFLSEIAFVNEIKRQNNEDISLLLFQTKRQALNLLEEIKGLHLDQFSKIFNRMDLAVLADILGFEQEVVRLIDEVSQLNPEDILLNEETSFPYLRYSYLGDYYRLKAKLPISVNIDRNLERASELYKEALKISRDDGKPMLYSRLSEVFILSGRDALARYDYERGNDLLDKAMATLEEWTQMLHYNIRLFSIALRKAEIYSLKAQISEAQGVTIASDLIKKAIETCQIAIQEQPNEYISYIQAINLHLDIGNVFDAIALMDQYCKAVLTFFRQNDDTRYYKRYQWVEFRAAQILFEYGFFEQSANRLITILIKTQPTNTAAAYLLSSILNSEINIEKAKAILNRFIGKLNLTGLTSAQSIVITSSIKWNDEIRIDVLLPQNALNLEFLSQCYFDLAIHEIPNSDKQIGYLTLSLNYNKKMEESDFYFNDVVIWTRRARIDLLLNNIKSAETILLKLLERYPDDSYIPFYLGDCYQRQEEYEKALTYYNRAYNIKPLIDSADRIAFCLSKLGEATSSMELFKRILKLKPSDVIALHRLGMIYYENDDKRKAVELWKDALRIRTSDYMRGDNTTSRNIQEAKWTARGIAGILGGDANIRRKVFNELLNENPVFVTLLIEQFTATSTFEKEIADIILEIVYKPRPLRLLQAIAQYCMGRAVFLTLRILKDENPFEWISRAIIILRNKNPKLVSELLAGGKACYMSAFRELVAAEPLDKTTLESLTSDIITPPIKWQKFFKHISLTLANRDYYVLADELIRELKIDDIPEYALFQIMELAKGIVRKNNLFDEIKNIVEEAYRDNDGNSIVPGIENIIKFYSLTPNVKTLWRLSDFNKAIRNGGRNIVVEDSESNWGRISKVALWFDGVSLSQFTRWCCHKISYADGENNIMVDWDIYKDNSVSCLFKTDKEVNKWPEGLERLLSANSSIAVKKNNRIGFIMLPVETKIEMIA